jgi:UDP-D-galactose:(glucosyl)LPS alpha-1,6-D-galactosyltransferase
MKIVLISNNTFSEYGGYEKVIYMVLNTFIESYNCDIKILSLPHYRALLNKPILKEFKTFKIDRASDFKNRIHYLFYISCKKFLQRKLNLNILSLKNLSCELIKADIILATDPLLLVSVKTFLKNYFEPKVVYWDHGSLFGYLRQNLQRLFYHNEIIEGIKLADAHLCISSEIEEFIKRISPKALTRIVYNPVPLYTGKLVDRSSFPTFLYVGRLDDNPKNISFMLKGLAKLKNKNWKLKIIGTGPDENKLKNLAKKLKILDRIEWLGFKKDSFGEITEATALLLTSRWEGFPMVLVEANQRGIPVISSDCKGGSKDIVIPGVNGYLYKEGDMNEFVKVVNGVIEGNLKFDSPENIAKTTERFREDIVIKNIYEFLKSLCKRRIHGTF